MHALSFIVYTALNQHLEISTYFIFSRPWDLIWIFIFIFIFTFIFHKESYFSHYSYLDCFQNDSLSLVVMWFLVLDYIFSHEICLDWMLKMKSNYEIKMVVDITMSGVIFWKYLPSYTFTFNYRLSILQWNQTFSGKEI